MTESGEQRAGLGLLQVAVSRKLLSQEAFETLLNQPNSSNLCDLAVEQGFLSAATIELLRPLDEASDWIPGYRFDDLIGHGASGAVYRAQQVMLERPVAVKLLSQSALQNDLATARSQVEARIGATLQHPHAVAVYDYGVHHQRVYIAQELIDGESLQQKLDREGPMDPVTALALIRQAASALAHAAEHNIIHRDVKPGNLLLAGSRSGEDRNVPTVKVSDFGLALRLPTVEESFARLTVDGAAVGTPSYMAPEQLVDSTVDIRADIYGLGATLYHMVTGQRPFHGASAFKAFADKLAGSENWRDFGGSDVPAGLQRLITDMTRHNHAARIQNYSDLERRLRDVDLHSVATHSRLWLRTAVVVVVGLVLSAAVDGARRYFAAVESSGPEIASTEQELLPSKSYFYRGDKMPDQRVHRVRGGQWKNATEKIEGLSGGNVLSGTDGVITFLISAHGTDRSKSFRFHVGLNPLDMAAVEVCFGVTRNPEETCYIVKIHNGRARIGTGDVSGSQPFMMLPDTPSVQLPFSPDEPIYQSIEIDRRTTGWTASVNGFAFATLDAQPDEVADVSLRVPEGTVHCTDIYSSGVE